MAAFSGSTYGAAVAAANPTLVLPPVGFKWDWVNYPVTINKVGGKYYPTCNPRAWIPGIWTAPLATGIFHVSSVSGNDTTGTGIGTFIGDFSTAVKTISRAITLANATAAPWLILLKGGEIWNRSNGLHTTAGTLMPTQDCGIISWGGRSTVHTADDLTWADDGTGNNTYTSTVANGLRCLDLLNFDSYTADDGSIFTNHKHLTNVADAAAVRASTTGAWSIVGGVCYAKRADLAAVTSSNTRLLRSLPVCRFDATTKNVFLKGIDFQGGTTHCLDASYAAVRNIVAEDCSFKYPNTRVATAGNGIAIDNMTGIAVFVRCHSGSVPTDALNGHQTANGPSYVLAIDFKAFDMGNPGATSCNGLTPHEDFSVIDVNGEYGFARGGTIRATNKSQAWIIGTYPHDDQGDGSNQAEIFAESNARIWSDGVRARGTVAVNVGSTAAYYHRNPFPLVGSQIGTGINTTFSI